ncbi:MAG: hypothetical protein KIS90_10105 [Phenylobacterium sp.]|nr:hypothetical protein [Phenylobacterium sp.]
MFQIDDPTAVGVLPAPAAAGAPGWFAHAIPGVQPPTRVTADFLNLLQDELINVVLAGGLAPDKATRTQLRDAILAIASGGGIVGAGSIHGMVLSNAQADPLNDITISAGLVRDSTNTASGVAGAARTKRLDAAWAAGDNAGGRLNAGAPSNAATYHVHALINPATGAVEYGFDTSPTAPTMTAPVAAGYTKFRRLGAVVLETAATTIRQFKQFGDWFEYKERSTDYAVQPNGAGVAYNRVFPGLPLGIEGRAQVYFQSTGTANATAYLSGLFSPQFGAPAAFGGASQRATVRRVAAYQQASAADLSYGTVDRAMVLFDTTQHIYTFSSDNAGDVIAAGIVAWEDLRGRFF